MISMNKTEVLAKLCKTTKKWGLFVSLSLAEGEDDFNADPFREMAKAAPIMENDFQMIFDEVGYFLFDTEDEVYNAYNMCVGDDGPTESNSYKGPARAYALVIDPRGESMTENT